MQHPFPNKFVYSCKAFAELIITAIIQRRTKHQLYLAVAIFVARQFAGNVGHLAWPVCKVIVCVLHLSSKAAAFVRNRLESSRKRVP